MANKRFDDSLREFIAEIGELDIPAFVVTHSWRLHEDIQNGVAIGHKTRLPIGRFSTILVADEGSSRCVPGDMVDLQTSDGSITAVVRTPFGTLPLKQRK